MSPISELTISGITGIVVEDVLKLNGVKSIELLVGGKLLPELPPGHVLDAALDVDIEVTMPPDPPDAHGSCGGMGIEGFGIGIGGMGSMGGIPSDDCALHLKLAVQMPDVVNPLVESEHGHMNLLPGIMQPF